MTDPATVGEKIIDTRESILQNALSLPTERRIRPVFVWPTDRCAWLLSDNLRGRSLGVNHWIGGSLLDCACRRKQVAWNDTKTRATNCSRKKIKLTND